MTEIRLVIAGAAGRMGHAVIREAIKTQGIKLAAGIEAPNSTAQGKDLGRLVGQGDLGARIESDPLPVLAKADALIDFTRPQVSLALADLAAQARALRQRGADGRHVSAAEELGHDEDPGADRELGPLPRNLVAHGLLGGLVGRPGLDLQTILGWALAPLAFLMGVPWDEAARVGSLLGLKTVLNEFLAYQALGEMIAAGELGVRSQVIASYALCGFANFGSLAILLGGLTGIAPDRRHEAARLGLRTIVAGSLATFMTGCVAGVFIGG